jgi:hypothetical protein
MTVACYLDVPKADHWMRAFAKGCGGRLVAGGRRDPEADDHCVMGNWPVASRLIPEFTRDGAPFWYLDSAYVRPPGIRRYLRVERERFWPEITPGEHTMDRASAMGVPIEPWRHDGRHVLICLHGYKFGRPWGIDIEKWHRNIDKRIRSVTSRPIVIRPKLMAMPVPLERDLKDAWCLVTHSSTAAVTAALAGVPVFCEPTCAAAPVGCTDFSLIDTPSYPDRETWLSELVWRQWSAKEMSSGEAWATLNA